MIRIHKSSRVPQTLSIHGVHAHNLLCKALDKDKFNSSSFQAGIYGAPDVKAALISAQHGKCCFCERKIFGDGDVEHFRPKAAISQGLKTKVLKPGYYWLAYDWSNLLLCCTPCNSRHKRNLFPLSNPSKRIRSHERSLDLSIVEPYFINPSVEDPEEFIRFDGPVAYAVDDNTRGNETIRSLGLDRDALVKIRRDRLELLRQVRGALLIAEKHILDPDWYKEAVTLRKILEDSQRDDAEFAGMARYAAALDFRSRD